MELLQIMGAAWLSKSVAVAARMGIADALIAGPLSVEQLAEVTGAHAASLARLIRVLCAFQIFTQTEDGLVANSRISEGLRSDHPLSMRHFCMLAGEEYYDGWGALLHTVKTGEPGFVHIFGGSVYDYLNQNPPAAAVYDRAMEDLSRPVGALLAREYGHRFNEARQVVDIGGGSGVVVKQVMASHAHLDGIVLDRHDVCQRAANEAESALGERLSYRSGDFFDDVPAGADIYLLKNVLHNWNEESCSRILDSTARAMSKRAAPDGAPARLLVVEPLVSPGETSPRLLMNALFQIVICEEGTRDRTADEMSALLQRSGFRIESTKPLPTGHTVVEALLQ